jgi:hypothetical protein
MKRFKDLLFTEMDHKPTAFNATLQLGHLDISVGYGEGLYGSGPSYDTYEVSVWDRNTEKIVPLSASDDVIGWQSKSEVDSLMVNIQKEPGFAEACRIFKRTQYNKCFDNISHMRDEAFSS